jgi:tetratricopeptide (TPR) repeat protein
MGDPVDIPVDSLYSVREVADLIGLSPRQVRSLIVDGIVEPSRGERDRFLFAFSDLVLLRAVSDLVTAGVARGRIRAAIDGLRAQLPDDASVTEARLDTYGRSVVASFGTDSWEPESGQTVLDLDVGVMAGMAAGLVEARPRLPPPAESAIDWYVYADAIEESDPVGAEEAYRRAIAIDDHFADAHLNLGRLLHASGAVRDALTAYQRALEIDPDDATTQFNVGVASQDLGYETEAIQAYERAIALAPRFADPRFNLAAIYEQRGDRAAAIRHLRAYRELVDGG